MNRVKTTGIIIAFFFGSCDSDRTFRIKTETIQVTSADDIVRLKKPLVKPVLYTHVPAFGKLPSRELKSRFISTVLPAVLIARYEIAQVRKKIARLRDRRNWTNHDSLFYREYEKRFDARDIDDLLVRMNTLPASIVLAQAAMESGWGRSRIFRKGNNAFGVWSFNKNEPRMAALVKRGNRTVYLRTYADLSRSVFNYFEIMGKAKSFEKLREVRATTDDPMLIVPHLKNYSERRTVYTKQLTALILKNNLTVYDRFVIDPAFIVPAE
jgi:Bax protein